MAKGSSIEQARGGFASTSKNCAITECRAQLLGMSYIVATLDDGRVIALCRPCYAKVCEGIKAKRAKGETR